MKFKTFTLLVLLTMLLGLTACGEKATPTRPPFKELSVPAGDVTLHVRITGDPRVGNVLIAIHGGPGMSSDYMLSLEQLANIEFAVVIYDQRGVGHTDPPEALVVERVGHPDAQRAREKDRQLNVYAAYLGVPHHAQLALPEGGDGEDRRGHQHGHREGGQRPGLAGDLADGHRVH